VAAEKQGLEFGLVNGRYDPPDGRRPDDRTQKATMSASNGQHIQRTLHYPVAGNQQIAALEEVPQLLMDAQSGCAVVGVSRMDVAAAGQNHLTVVGGAQPDIELGSIGPMVAGVAVIDPSASFVVAIEENGGQVVMHGFHFQAKGFDGPQRNLGGNLLPVKIDRQECVNQPIIVEFLRIGYPQKQMQAGLLYPSGHIAQGAGSQHPVDDQGRNRLPLRYSIFLWTAGAV